MRGSALPMVIIDASSAFFSYSLLTITHINYYLLFRGKGNP